MKSPVALSRRNSLALLAVLMVAILLVPTAFGERAKQSKSQDIGLTVYDSQDSGTTLKTSRIASKTTTQVFALATNTAGAIFTSMPTTGGVASLSSPVEVWVVNANTE